MQRICFHQILFSVLLGNCLYLQALRTVLQLRDYTRWGSLWRDEVLMSAWWHFNRNSDKQHSEVSAQFYVSLLIPFLFYPDCGTGFGFKILLEDFRSAFPCCWINGILKYIFFFLVALSILSLLIQADLFQEFKNSLVWVNILHCLWQTFHCKYNATFTTTETSKSQSLGITATSCNRRNFQKGRKVSWTGSDTVERALSEWRKFNEKYGGSGLKGRQRWNYFNASYCFLFIIFWLGKLELFANTCTWGRKNISTSFPNIFSPTLGGKYMAFYYIPGVKKYISSAIASGLLFFFQLHPGLLPMLFLPLRKLQLFWSVWRSHRRY